MSYGTVLEAEFFDNPEVLKLMLTLEGARAVLMLLELRTYSASAQSDGVIEAHVLRKATIHSDPDSAFELLESAGLVMVREDGAWLLDWESQKTADERQKQNDYWKIQKRHQRGNHDTCLDYWKCRNGNVPKDTSKDSSPMSSQESTKESSLKTRKGKSRQDHISDMGEVEDVKGKPGQNLDSTPSPSGGARPEPAEEVEIEDRAPTLDSSALDDDEDRAPELPTFPDRPGRPRIALVANGWEVNDDEDRMLVRIEVCHAPDTAPDPKSRCRAADDVRDEAHAILTALKAEGLVSAKTVACRFRSWVDDTPGEYVGEWIGVWVSAEVDADGMGCPDPEELERVADITRTALATPASTEMA
jgi:hypothetical protein